MPRSFSWSTAAISWGSATNRALSTGLARRALAGPRTLSWTSIEVTPRAKFGHVHSLSVAGLTRCQTGLNRLVCLARGSLALAVAALCDRYQQPSVPATHNRDTWTAPLTGLLDAVSSTLRRTGVEPPRPCVCILRPQWARSCYVSCRGPFVVLVSSEGARLRGPSSQPTPPEERQCRLEARFFAPLSLRICKRESQISDGRLRCQSGLCVRYTIALGVQRGMTTHESRC